MSNYLSSYSVRFHLALSAEKYMAYYKGAAQNIQVRSIDNKRIRFPASTIRKFLNHDGIYGLFEIKFDEKNKLIGIEKINPD